MGFSQVLGRNYGSLTESKSEREDQIEGKSSEDNNIEMGEMVNNKMASSEAARPELEQPVIKCHYGHTGPPNYCNTDWECRKCTDCPNTGLCNRSYWTGAGKCFCN